MGDLVASLKFVITASVLLLCEMGTPARAVVVPAFSVGRLGVGDELVPECAVVLRGDLGCGHDFGVAGRL